MPHAKRFKEIEAEIVCLKKLLAESLLKMEATREALRKVVSAPARRGVVRFMVSRGLSERRALHVIRMRASALRYQSAPDRNEVLREHIVALAHRHRRLVLA